MKRHAVKLKPRGTEDEIEYRVYYSRAIWKGADEDGDESSNMSGTITISLCADEHFYSFLPCRHSSRETSYTWALLNRTQRELQTRLNSIKIKNKKKKKWHLSFRSLNFKTRKFDRTENENDRFRGGTTAKEGFLFAKCTRTI